MSAASSTMLLDLALDNECINALRSLSARHPECRLGAALMT
jgi:hypothetical protein